MELLGNSVFGCCVARLGSTSFEGLQSIIGAIFGED